MYGPVRGFLNFIGKACDHEFCLEGFRQRTLDDIHSKTVEEMRKMFCFEALEDAKLHEAFGDVINHLRMCSKESAFELHVAYRLHAGLLTLDWPFLARLCVPYSCGLYGP